MATRILRSGPPGALEPYRWPQIGRPVQEVEQELLRAAHAPAPPEAASDLRQDSRLEEELEAAEARHRAELESARQEAFQKGLEEGRRQAASHYDAALGRLARALEEIAGLKPRLRAEVEREAVDLALAIARRVLRRELHVDPEAVVGLAKAAFEKAALREVTAVRLHPAHAAAVRSHLGRIGAPQAIDILEDPSLEPGAVIVETVRGSIDASISSQLEEIERGLADALAGGAG